MRVNDTIELLKAHAPLNPEPDKVFLLRRDIIQAIKFELGDEFLGVRSDNDGEQIRAPKLPYDKVYLEAISWDGRRYGALFENDQEYGVCGQMLVQAVSEGGKMRGLFPIGVLFTQDGDFLNIHVPRKEGFEDMEMGAIAALILMVTAIEVINCSNVIVLDSPEPKHINRARAKKGKLPLYTFKTLHIKTGPRMEREGRGAGTTHAPPRVHLRRGHIRRLANGNTVWVQPCVVGDKTRGVVHKDYSVSAH